MPAWIYLTIGVMVAIILFLFFTNKEQTEQILKLEDKIKNNEIKESVSLEKLSIDDSYLLRNEIVSLTSQLSVSEKKVELLQKMCAQVAIQLEESNKEKNALSNEIETLRSIGYSKKPYALSLQRVSQMELETVNSENEALKEENASLLKRLEELKSEATPQVAEDNTPTRYCGTPFIKEIHTLEEKITSQIAITS